MLDQNNSILIIIDIQEKLVKAAYNGEEIAENATKLAQAANILGIDTIITEQYPKGLGKTVPTIEENLTDNNIICEKTAFSALAESDIKANIEKLNKKQIVICGIETHICVLQTVIDLIDNGYEVYVIQNASTSRKKVSHDCALKLMQQKGAQIIDLEIALFEWLRTSSHPNFKAVQSLIK